MLLCSCRKMCTFAAKIAQNRFNEHEFRIYIAPFPAYLLAILSMAISEWRESAGHCRCAIRLIAEGVEEVSDEYYRVNSLENYDEVYRAVAYFAFRYGRIDYWGYDSAHDWAWWRKQIVYFMDHLLTEETVEYVI